LTVVNNTALPFISGTFDNLAQGQAVALSYNGVTYNYVANYYGGTGNDLVLVWASNRAFAWGKNNAGQLGNKSTTSSNIPIAVTTAGTPLANRTLMALSTGSTHSLALCSDSTLASWGYNNYGQLGNSTTINSNAPVAVTTTGTALEGKVVVAVASGFQHNLVLCSDGTMASWGLNGNFQPGNNTVIYSSVPVAITTASTPIAGKTVIAVNAGDSHCLVLCSDGTLAAWGNNLSGQLGNNTISRGSLPVAVRTAGTVLASKSVVSMAAGGYHNIALCSDGTLVTWGRNSSGQLGNNTTTNSTVPAAVLTAGTVLAGKNVIAVAAGYSHSLALCSDGTLAAWGDNSNGQLGNNTTFNSKVPVSVNTSGVLTGKTIVRLTAGYVYSVAQCSDGTVATWGANAYGELGNNTFYSSSIPVVVSASTLTASENFSLFSSGQSADHNLGIVASPALVCSTLAATSVTATTAIVNGIVNPNGGALPFPSTTEWTAPMA
jgi:alpha-tubulin suppressor-like RCC1 family protein